MHLDPSRVTAVLFDGRHPFFLPEDKVQVKYEMLRAHLVDGMSVTAAAATHGIPGLPSILWPPRSARRAWPAW